MKKLFFTILSLLLIVSFVFVGCKNPYMPDAPETPSTQTTYTVKFFYQDETSAGNDVKGQAGQTVNLPTLKEKNGKIFSGWYLTKSVTGTAISQDLTGGKYTISVTDASSDKVISLYAIYIDSSSAIQVESISVNPATVNLQVGGYQQLSVIYNPSNANVGKSVTWNSSNESVATVDANGLVKACAIGNSTITATIANGKTASVKVIVSSKEKVLKKLTLSKISDTSFTAIAKYDDNTTEDVTSQAVWTSKNTTVATVDSGIVQILKAGTTNIFASYTYKNVTKTTDEATILVQDSSSANVASDVLVVYVLSNYDQVKNGIGHIYAWKGSSTPYGSWPGTPMTSLTSDGAAYYFVIEDTSNIESLIINNGSDAAKTDDMNLPAQTGHWLCWHNGSAWAWKEYDGVKADVGENSDTPSDGEFSVTVTMPSVSGDAENDNDNQDNFLPDGLYVFVKASSAPTIWAWEANNGATLSANLGETWPGNTMATAYGMNDPSGWYMKDFSNASATGKTIMFKLNSSEPEITGLSKTFWYDGTQCYDVDPTVPPEPVAPSVKVSPSNGATVGLDSSITVSFNAGNDIENFTASITIDGVTYTYGDDFNSLSKSFSIKNDLGISTNDTITIYAECENSIGIDNYSGTVSVDVSKKTDTFTWDNVNAYFVLTDRFANGDSSNDYSYYRKNGLSGDENVATFHGGDIKGLTQNMDYFKKLGINAIWITAPYEQVHGWVSGKYKKFPHYAFHGYYTLDWTFMDKNMGTIDEFREFVQTCHTNGIRVIMDVVMNHVGYNNTEDMITYNHGYTDHKEHGWLSKVNGVWDANDTVQWDNDLWENWWGYWARSFGYSNGSEYGGSCGGLPDIKSEDTSTNKGIAPILKTKWSSENNSSYDAWRVPAVANVDWWNKSGNWRTDKTARIVEYQVIWLSSWVREFGIDGFRCDTAKHVEPQYWGMLKDACTDALNKWRADPSKVDNSGAKDWDESFWMTGECWGWTSTSGGGEYYNTGKFDSMINFSFNGGNNWDGNYRTSYPQSSAWGNYLSVNNNADSDGNGNRDNVLSYISSHDTGLTRVGDQYEVGTGLVLLPGGVQIYYGDESYREKAYTGCGDGDMMTRGDMNLSEAKSSALTAHWGKVGNFRKYNPAVGAGTGSATKRTYSGSAGESKVAIGINGSSVDVSGLFVNGTTVYNWYDGKSATVSNGKVTFNGGSMKQPILVSDKNPADFGVTF